MGSKEISILVLAVLCIGISYFLLNNGEDMNYYQVLVGEEEVSYQVLEDTSRIYLKDVFESNVHNEAYSDKELVEVSLKKLSFHITKSQCYDKKGGNRIDCKPFYSDLKIPALVETTEFPTSLKIMRNEEIIYDGKYREDLNAIIKEKGRYYFIATYEELAFKSVKTTKLLFSIKVGDSK